MLEFFQLLLPIVSPKYFLLYLRIYLLIVSYLFLRLVYHIFYKAPLTSFRIRRK